MAERFECPDCETVVIGSSRCPACGWARAPDKLLPIGPPPCTREQNMAAVKIFSGVLDAVMRKDAKAVEEGQRRMAELFGERNT